MAEFDRRAFLRMSIGAVAGIATGTISLPVSIGIAEGIQQATGMRVGNTHLEDAFAESCDDQGLSKAECFDEMKKVITKNEPFLTVIGPVLEEGSFRAIPSFILSATDPEEDAMTTISGRSGSLLSRRELVAGVISTALFAGMHSLTKEGLEGIPAPQAVSGFSFWYLQRRFGFLANTLAHITHNSIATQIIKNTSFPQA